MVMVNQNTQPGKDGKMAFEGGDLSLHSIEAGSVFGTAEGDPTQGSVAPEFSERSLVRYRRRSDSAERWLHDNDPKYTESTWNG